MTSNYWVSTQCNHWILNQTQLAIAKAEDLHYASSPEEYTALKIWLINCICLLTKRLSLRQRITATSIIFFHRFYSCSPANSFSSTDPSLVATACVYVASKVEETPVHIRNVVQEASKLWTELGHWKFPNDVSSLAEMEFYLLEDLQFHLIVYHPYRSLMAIHSSSGKGATKFDLKMTASPTWTSLIGSAQNTSAHTNPSTPASAGHANQGPVGSGDLGGPSGLIDPELAYGSPGSGLAGRSADSVKASVNGEAEKIRQLDRQSQIRVMQEMFDERNRMFIYGGDDSMPLPRLEELDEQVLQMAWFVLNDTYRTEVLLLYPPHLVAVAAIFLAFVLHDPTRDRLMRSKKVMDDRRERYKTNLLHPRESKNKTSAKAKPWSGSETSKDISKPNTPPVTGTSPPKPMQPAAAPSPNVAPSPSSAQTSRPPLRGLASLPPRPAHLPMKPVTHINPHQSISQQHLQQTSTPSTSVQASPQIGASPAQTGSPNSDSPSRNPMHSNHSSNDLSPAIVAAAEMNATNPPVPPPDAMTFLAALNVDLNAVGEIVQEMLGLYDIWHKVGNVGSGNVSGASSVVSSPDVDGKQSNREANGKEVSSDPILTINITDGPEMFRRLTKMREKRREDLLKNGGGM